MVQAVTFSGDLSDFKKYTPATLALAKAAGLLLEIWFTHYIEFKKIKLVKF